MHQSVASATLDSITAHLEKLTISDPSIPPFLALPLELRLKIYKELFHPYERSAEQSINSEKTLRKGQDGRRDVSRYTDTIGTIVYDHWDDWNKRFGFGGGDDTEGDDDNCKDVKAKVLSKHQGSWTRASFGFPAAMLRVNQQLRDEATALLYQRVSCEIGLLKSSPFQTFQDFCYIEPGCGSDPQDHRGRDRHIMIASWAAQYRENDPRPIAEEALKLDCLCHVQNITIRLATLAYGAIIKKKQKLSRMGTILLRLLRHLDREAAMVAPITKRLQVDIRGYDNPFISPLEQILSASLSQESHGGNGVLVSEAFQGLVEVILLLRSIRKSRIVILRQINFSVADDFYRKEIDLHGLAWIEGLRV